MKKTEQLPNNEEQPSPPKPNLARRSTITALTALFPIKKKSEDNKEEDDSTKIVRGVTSLFKNNYTIRSKQIMGGVKDSVEQPLEDEGKEDVKDDVPDIENQKSISQPKDNLLATLVKSDGSGLLKSS